MTPAEQVADTLPPPGWPAEDEDDPVAEHRRDEGLETLDEERAERHLEWAERSW